MSLYIHSELSENMFPITPCGSGDDEIYEAEKESIVFQILVTPELAKTFLDNQIENNRNVSQETVSKYKRDILEGNWEESAINPLRFVNGVMYDGQHRCYAIIQANTAIFCWVCVSEGKIPANIDTGRPRSVPNILSMSGFKGAAYGTNGVSIVNFLYRYYLHVRSISVLQAKDFAEKYEKNIEKAVQLSRLKNGNTKEIVCRTAPTQSAIFCALEYGIEEDTIAEFCQIANTGFMNENWQTSAIILSKYKRSIAGGGSSDVLRNKLFLVSQEAILDFIRKNPRKIMYKGEKAFFSDAIKDKLF